MHRIIEIMHRITSYYQTEQGTERSQPSRKKYGPAPAPGQPPAPHRDPPRLRPGGGGTRTGTRGVESWVGLRRSALGNVYKPHRGDYLIRGGFFSALTRTKAPSKTAYGISNGLLFLQMVYLLFLRFLSRLSVAALRRSETGRPFSPSGDFLLQGVPWPITRLK